MTGQTLATDVTRSEATHRMGTVPRYVTQWMCTILLTAACMLPVVFLHTPPMVDALGHIGRYAIQTGLNDHPWLKSYYGFEWKVIGNLGADLMVQALTPFLDVVGAANLVVILTSLLSASSILLLARLIHGRITATSILALTLVYTSPFTWGFLNFSLAMALAMLSFNMWLLCERAGQARTQPLLLLILGLLTWICHTFGWALLGILCASRCLTTARQRGSNWPRTFADTTGRCLPLLAPLLPMFLWRSDSASSGINDWFNLIAKITWITGILRLNSEWIDKASAAFLLLVTYFGWRSPRVRVDRTMATAAALALSAFLLLPGQIFGSLYADMRLAPYVVMLALISLRIEGPPRHMLMALALSFLGARLFLTAHTYYQREQILDKQMEALTAIPQGARLATLVQRPCESDWQMPWLTHIGSLALARKQVFANDQWAYSGMNLLSVHYPAAGDFATDDAEIAYPEHCQEFGPTVAQSLARLPLAAFTHVWILGVSPERMPHRDGLKLVWKRPDAALFAVTGEHASETRAIRKLSKFQP